MTGNTYNTREVKFSHARKVWREIRQMYPAGGRVVNIEDWVEKKVIPAGTLALLEENANGGKEITCYTPEQASSDLEGEHFGFTDRDLPIIDGNTVGTITVVYDGEIYKYMLDEKVAAAARVLVPGVKQVL